MCHGKSSALTQPVGLKGVRRVAMSIFADERDSLASPRVDAGTIELIRSFGYRDRDIRRFVQQFEAVWTTISSASPARPLRSYA